MKGTFGILNPLKHIKISDIMKHCCKDLIEIEAKEVKTHSAIRSLNYTIYLSQSISDSAYLSLELSVTGESGYNTGSQKSLVSVTQKSMLLE